MDRPATQPVGDCRGLAAAPARAPRGRPLDPARRRRRGVDSGCAGPRRRPPAIVAEAPGCLSTPGGPRPPNGRARLAAMRARVAVLRTRPETVVADYGRLL